MVWKTGDVWFWHKLGHTIVIPTNAGWRSDGQNVMGRGLAQSAAKQFDLLPSIYGADCKRGLFCKHYDQMKLILIPSKPLVKETPFLSWKQNADIKTIKESLNWLESHMPEIVPFLEEGKFVYVPILGAGNGKLNRLDIMALMDRILTHPRLIGVTF